MSNLINIIIEFIQKFFSNEKVKKILKEILWTVLQEISKMVKENQKNNFAQ